MSKEYEIKQKICEIGKRIYNRGLGLFHIAALGVLPAIPFSADQRCLMNSIKRTSLGTRNASNSKVLLQVICRYCCCGLVMLRRYS